jgi:hypothetical protein
MFLGLVHAALRQAYEDYTTALIYPQEQHVTDDSVQDASAEEPSDSSEPSEPSVGRL